MINRNRPKPFGFMPLFFKEHTDIAENLKTIDLSEVKACLS